MVGILARVGQNVFRGCIVNHWYRSELSTSGGVLLIGSTSRGPVFHAQWLQSGGTAWRTSKMPKFVCRKAKQFMEEFEQLLRDGFGDSDPWKELCVLTPQPEDVAVWF